MSAWPSLSLAAPRPLTAWVRRLNNNQIGHGGAMAIKEALEKGCCPKLRFLE